MSQYNPNIHTANDTLAVSGNNANHAIKFAKLATAYVAELAKASSARSRARDPVALDQRAGERLVVPAGHPGHADRLGHRRAGRLAQRLDPVGLEPRRLARRWRPRAR